MFLNPVWHPLVLVVGQDAANGLDQWHRWTELLHLAHLVVVTRPGEQPRYAGTLAQVLDEARVADPQALQRAPAGYTLDLPIAENDIFKSHAMLLRESIS